MQNGIIEPDQSDQSQSTIEVIGEILLVPTSQIRPMKGQPRTNFDQAKLIEFGENLKEQEQIQPVIVVRLDEPDKNGCLYELVSGERRWRASKIAKIPKIKVVVGKRVDPLQQFIDAIIANCHSEELSTLETIQAVGRLHAAGKTDMEIAKIFGKRSSVWTYQHRRALELTPEVLKLMGPEIPEEKRIPLSSANLLVGLPQEEQMGFAELISEKGLSAKQVNHLVKNRLAECGSARRTRSKDEFDSARKFFLRMNAEFELYIDHGESRIENLFKNRTPDEVKLLLRLIKDCSDNLTVVQRAFQEGAPK